MRGLRCGISTDSLTVGVEVVFVMEAPTLANFPMSMFLSSIYFEKKGVCRGFVFSVARGRAEIVNLQKKR